MAPAIAHFLAGAAILLFLMTPFAFRYNTDRNWALWLVPLGGVWGLLPDFHHVSPFAAEWLYEKHTASWVDVFALHHTLDRPTIRGLYHETIFWSIAVFFGTVIVYSVSSSLQLRDVRASTTSERRLATVLAFLIASGYAGFVTGVALSAMGILHSLAGIIGSSGLIIAGVLLAPLSVLGGLVVWGLIQIFGSTRHRLHPVAGATAGVPIGLATWLVGVVFVYPVWLRVVVEKTVSFPLFHWPSVVPVVVFCVMFGLVFSTVRGAFEPSVPNGIEVG